jgi:hypothetical protein
MLTRFGVVNSGAAGPVLCPGERSFSLITKASIYFPNGRGYRVVQVVLRQCDTLCIGRLSDIERSLGSDGPAGVTSVSNADGKTSAGQEK